MKHLIFKSSFHEKLKFLIIPMMLLTLGVGQMWGGTGFYQVYMKYDNNGSENNYTYNGSNGSLDLGTITSSFKIKEIYLKVWDDWGDMAFEAGKSGLGYKTQSGSDTDYKTNTRTGKSGNNYELQATSMNLTIASSTNPSGNYTFEHWWFAAGTYQSALYIKNSSNNCKFTYKILPPAVKSSSVSISATNTAAGSGTGLTSGSPIILISGMGSTLTITATQNHTDANSALWCKFASGSYSSTTTYAISSGTTQTNQTVALKVKYRNNSASLDGAETTTTIYYKWAAPAPAISLTSVTPSSSIVAGNDITLVGTRANSTNAISFQYTTNNGSTWTDITPKTASGTSPKTITWTVPAAHGATQTYKFRAKLAESTPIYSSASDAVSVYGTKTIRVKNTNGWSSLYLYAWDSGSNKLNGNWPGTTGAGSNGLSCTNTGGQWWDVTITSQVTGFVLDCNVSGNANQTADLSYTTYTNNRCLAISTTTDGSGKRTLPSTAVDCPSAPDVTTAAAGSFTNSKATLNASGVAANNDAITAYGFKWGITNACTNTQAASNLSGTTFSYQLTGLTAGTTYYFKAYATNGQGTTYGEVKSFTVPYKVTITKPTGCSAMTPGTSTQYVKVGDAITATAATGYQFSSWTVSNLTLSTPSTTSGVTTSTITAISSDNGTITAVYNPITYSNLTLGKTTGSADGKYSVTYNATSLTVTTAPTKTGYSVEGYYKTYSSSTWTTKVATANGTLQASAGYTDADKKWTSTASPTLYTKWTAKQYNITLDKKEGSANGSAKVKYDATTLTNISDPTRTGYHVTGYYGETDRTNMVADASGDLQSNVSGFTTGTKWSKDADGTVTLYTKWAANTYTIHYNPNNDQYVGEATGSMDDQAATWGNYPTLTSNGFTREGYTFAGWATSPTGAVVYSNGQTLSTNLTDDNNATVTLYAKWTGKEYTVTFNARGGSGLTPTSKKVTMGSAYGALATVTPPAGYVFDGWYTSAGGGTKVTSATQVTTAVDHTLYAHYIQKAQVYFKNTLGWENVYVTFDATWDGTQGAGNKGRTYRTMTQIPGTDIWYHDIPDNYLSAWAWNIAFNNTFQSEYYAFTKGEAVFRHDFDKKATMFVPTSNTGTSDDGNYTKNGVQYRSTGYKDGTGSDPEYTSGYWRTYNNTYSGYTMTYQKKDGPWSSGHKMECAQVGDNTFIYTVHMDANSQYNFAFYKERDLNYKSEQFCYDHNTQINSGNCTNLVVKCEPQNSWMQTTVEGDYVFKLEMKNDGHMYLTVEYPFKENDYRVLYTWNDGSSHEFASEIIPYKASSNETISVFVHKVESPITSRSLKIQYCSNITGAGAATWTDVSGATIALTDVTKNGVYDFIITQPAAGNPSGALWKKHDENYYIRTQCADGGWDFYRERSDNLMTLSEYSLTQTLSAPYSHYYCRFIESTSTDITYCIATDYSPNISGILVGDATIGGNNVKTLPASANVRFTWNEETNAMFRAYLKNAQNENERFLVLHGSDNKVLDASGNTIPAAGNLNANELLFTDLGNWIYQVNLQAQPGAKVSLIANYNNADRYLIGGASSFLTIIDGEGSAKYEMITVYDFKTNRLMTAWTPSGEVSANLTDVDVLLIRYKQDAGTAITLATGKTIGNQDHPVTVIGAIRFDYNDMVGHVANWTNSSRPLLKYFISFPFNVKVSDLFGLNSAYGDAYVIQKYAGDERAQKGFFRGDGTTTFWKDLKAGDVMKANEGYCVILDNDYFNGDVGDVWQYKSAGSSVYLYFPSAETVGEIATTSKTVTVPERTCTIDRSFTSGGRSVNHQNTDSHWNMMGVPIFNTHSDNGTAGQPGAVFADSGQDGDGHFNYYYQWGVDNSFTIHTAKNEQFKSMHGYMVQYHGDVTFKTAAAPASVAARKAPMEDNYQLELQVRDNNDEILNRAYVELRENACDTFALNEDVYMSFNNRAVNVYTLAGSYDVAANVLSVGNHTIPVCVEVTKAGQYTFSMPSNFSGEVTLVDLFNNERINLSTDDYEVDLTKGVTEDRFLLELNINKVVTSIDGINGEGTLKDGKAHKFLQNGILYILQNGVLYDARGARVQ